MQRPSPPKCPVDPQRWAKIERIFAQAVELPAVQQAGFVASQAAGDNALAAEVVALLETDRQHSPMLDGQQFGRPGEDAERMARNEPAVGRKRKRNLSHVTLGDRYELTRLIGEGGMGAVYEARHTGTGRRTAVKVISPDRVAGRAVLRRFEVEARAAGRIESNHVAQVLDVGFDESEGTSFLAIEYLDGMDLSMLFRSLAPLEPSLALRLVAQACRGLKVAHAQDIVHRDIKPANLFLTNIDDDLRIVKILDFGIAKLLDPDALNGRSAITRTGAILGSPLYMSPEQALGTGDVDHRSDLWSLGTVLFEALTGTTPYDRDASLSMLLVAITSQPIPPVQQRAPWLAESVAAIVDRALQKDRSGRYASASEMLSAIEAQLTCGLEIKASGITRFSPVAPAAAKAAFGEFGPTGTVAMDPPRTPPSKTEDVTLPMTPAPADTKEESGSAATSLSVVAATLEPSIPKHRMPAPLLIAGVGAVFAVLLGIYLMRPSSHNADHPDEDRGATSAMPLETSADRGNALPPPSTIKRPISSAAPTASADDVIDPPNAKPAAAPTVATSIDLPPPRLPPLSTTTPPPAEPVDEDPLNRP